VSKKGVANTDGPLDLVGLALLLGASFVARGFAGDKAQLVPLVQAAISHKGSAIIDVISPCIAFNNHAGSTKSYDYVREHNEAVNQLDLVPSRNEITVDYAAGETVELAQHDGTFLRLHKLREDYDPHDRIGAMNYLHEHQARGEVVTGLLYVDTAAQDLHAGLETVETPLNLLSEAELCPGAAVLEHINSSLR